MVAVILAGSILVASCGPSFKVPTDITGDVPITVSNHTDAALCEFDMGLVGHKGGNNWIGLIKPQAGARLAFKVKPGTYWVVVNGCQGWFKAGSKVVVNGPTDLVLNPMNGGRRDIAPVAGHASADVPVIMTRAYFAAMAPPAAGPAAPQGGGGGEAPAAAAEPECGHLAAYCGDSWPSCCEGTSCQRTDRTDATGGPVYECH